MTLLIQKPTGAKLNLAKANNGIVDPDAIIYINNVEKADGENLEYDTAKAIHDFVVGCKADGIWPAIKASCILAGARTLAGALVPLVGTAPTNVGGLFVSGDFNRKTGLKGNASNKSLRTGLLANSLSSTSHHFFINGSDFEVATTNFPYVFGGCAGSTVATLFDLTQGNSPNKRETRSGTGGNSAGNSATITSGFTASGSLASSRTSATSLNLFQNGLSVASASNSNTPSLAALALGVFARNDIGPTANFHTAARLNYFSFGDGLSTANTLLLHNRVTDLINAFGAAIP
jgi:hypothetical protein